MHGVVLADDVGGLMCCSTGQLAVLWSETEVGRLMVCKAAQLVSHCRVNTWL
jgi:hypothetical protein